MGNRRIGNKRIEALIDNLLTSENLNGLNGSPFSIKDPDRYYIEEYFADGLPQKNATIDGQYDAEASRLCSRTVELDGANVVDGDCTRATTGAGIVLSGGTNGDAAIITGHLDASGASLGLTKWGTECQLQFETLIRTGASIASQTWCAGWMQDDATLNAAAVMNHATNDDAAYFLYGDTNDDAGALADNTKLHFVINHGAGNDVRVQLPITVTANTTYRLGIVIDSSRKVSIFVNGIQYSLQGLIAAAEYTSTGAGSIKSAALSNDIDFLPVVGIQQQAGDNRTLNICYVKCSRVAFDNA